MKSKIIAGGLVALACCMATACGSGETAPPPTSSSAPAPSVASPTPTPTESAATFDLKSVILTDADLGSPWTMGGSTDVEGLGPQDCPEPERSKVPVASRWAVTYSHGGEPVPILTIRLALAGEDASALKAAYLADLKACKNFKAADTMYTSDTAEGPTSIAGADEVLVSYVRRYYADEAKSTLYFARQVIVTRTGGVVSRVEYGFRIGQKDPKGKNFDATTKIAKKQVAKITDAIEI